MLNINAIHILSEAYKKIASFGYDIHKNIQAGLNTTLSQQTLWSKLINTSLLYERILSSVILSNDNSKILALKDVTEEQMNALLSCLKNVAEIDYIPVTSSPLKVIEVLLTAIGNQGVPGNDGEDSFVYIRYAQDNVGTDFSATPDASRKWVSLKSSNIALPDIAATHAGNWQKYLGDNGATGAPGANGSNGTNGTSQYIFQAWATDNSGTNFTLTFNASYKYTAFLIKNNNSTPVQADFNGLWGKYIGENGTNGNTILTGNVDPSSGDGVNGDYYINNATWTVFGPKAGGSWPIGVSIVGPQGPTGSSGSNGSNGSNGTNGINSFIYIAHADDNNGTGYILIQSNDNTATLSAPINTKQYVAVITTDTAIGTTISQSDFAGLWVRFAGDGDKWSTTSATSILIGTGTKLLFVGMGLAYVTGQNIVIAVSNDPNSRMEGRVIDYNPSNGQLSVDVTDTSGTGTYNVWDVSIQGSSSVGQFAIPFSNTNVDTGTTTIDSFVSTNAKRVIWEYLIEKSTNSRQGIISAGINGTTVFGEETSTDFGTVDIILDVDVNAGNIRLLATATSDDWTVKGLRRIITA